jgi:hypothetical protein
MRILMMTAVFLYFPPSAPLQSVLGQAASKAIVQHLRELGKKAEAAKGLPSSCSFIYTVISIR